MEYVRPLACMHDSLIKMDSRRTARQATRAAVTQDRRAPRGPDHAAGVSAAVSTPFGTPFSVTAKLEIVPCASATVIIVAVQYSGYTGSGYIPGPAMSIQGHAEGLMSFVQWRRMADTRHVRLIKVPNGFVHLVFLNEAYDGLGAFVSAWTGDGAEQVDVERTTGTGDFRWQ